MKDSLNDLLVGVQGVDEMPLQLQSPTLMVSSPSCPLLSPFLGVCFVLAIEKIGKNNKFARTTTNREMMLCNDFPG